MTEKTNNSFLKVIKRLYSMAFKACPIRIGCYILVVFLNGFSSVAITYFTQRFFDEVEKAVYLKVITASVLITVTSFIIIILLRHVLNGIDNYLGDTLHGWLGGYYREKLHEKVDKIDPIMFENQEFLDNTNKAIEGVGVEGSTYTLVAVTVVLASYVPYAIFMGIYLYTLQPILSIAILMIFIPVLVSQILRTKLFVKVEDESAQIRREKTYYEQCICHRENFKETRLLGAYNYFINLYKRTTKNLNEKIWEANCKSIRIEIILEILTLIGYVAVLFMLIYFVLKGEISIGAFAAVFASIGVMFDYMESAINFQIGGITSRLGAVSNFINFLDYPERHGEEKEVDFTKGIHMKNVSFKYPGSKEDVIKNVSLDIDNGETIAIVGENGAGKSTLVRILTGIYKPTEGKVIVGDADTKTVAMSSILKGISGVFQNYQRYQMSLKDNVKISDFSSEENEEEIRKSIDKVDLKIDELTFTKGIDTMLSREFDGIDLSGGQWQRIAIARGVYRDKEIIILDEPTAAIDPIEEVQIYKHFKEISKGKLSILVTHRLGSAKIADRIIVMDKGRLVEIGTHEELMKQEGKYAYMFNSQAKWYLEKQAK